MDIFNILPSITTNGVNIVDISKGIKIVNNIKQYLKSYKLKDYESVHDVSYNIYGNDVYWWLITLINPNMMLDPFKNTTQFDSFINSKYNVTALQLTSLFNSIETNNLPLSLKCYDEFNNEIPITKIDNTRKQVVLDRLVDGNVSLVYIIGNDLYSINSSRICKYTQSDPSSNDPYADIFAAYDPEIDGPISDWGNNYDYFSPVCDVIQENAAIFNTIVYRDAIAYYDYQGALYETQPTGIDLLRLRSYTWEEYAFLLNERKRIINIIPKENLDDAIRTIQQFSDGIKSIENKYNL